MLGTIYSVRLRKFPIVRGVIAAGAKVIGRGNVVTSVLTSSMNQPNELKKKESLPQNAAAKGHLEIVRLLLDHGADVNLAEEGIAPHGHALYAAAANRHFDIAKLLLEHGAYANPEVESSADALSRAISNKDQPMIELLCSYGAARAVHLLAYDGDVQTAAAVFAANAALAKDPEALANAAGQGHEPFMRLMLRYQPDLPRRLTFPAWSVGGKTHALNELLFRHGMDPSQPDWLLITPLHQFARNGNVESARQFLDRMFPGDD